MFMHAGKIWQSLMSYIKTPDRNGLGMWMMSCPEAMGWGFWVIFEKKQLVVIWTKTSPIVCCGVRARWLGQWVESWRWTKSQHYNNCVSLSSCRKPKSQEGNKSFVPEPRESSVFQDSYAFIKCSYAYRNPKNRKF